MAGGWKGSTRRSRLPADWPQRVAAVLKRDGYRCTHVRVDTETRCTERATDADHVVHGDDHRLSNLAAKCGYHHREKTAGEGNRARAAAIAAQKARAAAENAQHPGVLPLGGGPPPPRR